MEQGKDSSIEQIKKCDMDAGAKPVVTEAGGRDSLFDNMKAVLVFFVVSAHYVRVSGDFDVSSAGGMYYIIAFSFIMQGFLLISGYFSKNTEKCRRGAFKNFLMPYLLLMPVMFMVRLVLFGDASLDLMRPSHALWYLLVMFVYRFLIKDIGRVPGIVLLSASLMLASGCFSSLGEELALGRMCSFLVFFVIGYKLKPRHVEKLRSIPKTAVFVILAILLAFSYLTAVSSVIPVEMWHLKDGYSIYHLSDLEGIFVRLVLGIVSLLWMLVILNLTPRRKTFLSDIGRRTLTVYIFHIPVRYAVKAFSIPVDGILGYAFIFVLAAASVYVFSRPALDRAYSAAIEFIYDTVILRAFGMLKHMKRGIEDGIRTHVRR